MNYFFLAISEDTPPRVSFAEENYQRALLKLFFADIDLGFLDELTHVCRNAPYDYLQWDGVTLKDGLVDSVTYESKRIGNLNIHALPHSTTVIYVIKCRQKYAVQTRLLPKKLNGLYLQENEIFGTIDLTHLPGSLRRLYAFSNNICGPIDLTNLPRGLLDMSLALNRIDQEVVLYGNLPPNLLVISLIEQNTWNGVKAVSPISPADKISDEKARKVFPDIRHE